MASAEPHPFRTNRLQAFVLRLVAGWLLTSLTAESADFTIARPDDSPGPVMLDVQRRVVEAYQKIGITAAVLSLPALRSAAYTKQDMVDAELLRVDVPERDNDFIRIDVPLVVYDVVAIGRSGMARPISPASLHGLKVGILRGVLALAHTAAQSGSTELAPDYNSLNRMLEEGRIDIALMLTVNYPDLIAKRSGEWERYHLTVLNPRLQSYPAYHYISPRHADLVAALTRSLRTVGLPVPTVHAED